MPSVLLVGHALPPSRRPCARRMVVLGTGLAARGWQVTALTMQPFWTAPNDPGPVPELAFPALRTPAFVPRIAFDRLRAGLRGAMPSKAASAAAASGVDASTSASGKGWRAWLSRFAAPLEFPDPFVGWLPFALAGTQGRRFDIVVATLPWFSTGLVGRAVARRTGARLVLDYRDPWSELLEVTEARRGAAWLRRHRSCEDELLAAAARVTAVTERIAGPLRARAPCPVEVLPHTVLPAAPRPAADGEVRLVYTGSLAYGRSLAALFDALARVAPRTDRPFRFVYAGPNGDAVLRQARASGLDAGSSGVRVEVLGEVGRTRALDLARTGHANLVLVAPAYAYSHPSKLFDAAGAVPTLLLGPEGEAADLVARHGLGWALRDDDADGLDGALLDLAQGSAPRPVGLEALHPDAVVAHLDGILRDCLSFTPKGAPC